ncbi:MAG: chemotaxis protein CheD [Bacteroidota bacterium]|nr:chemotaxis protein CheD [Bacteroidota bacterium]MDP4191287.1 chemotaxis protein CheD [Bacteroidota bacterium]MDP4195632.1 chemotaxis protein CheD [Bacteroidota bacterium]
MKVREKIHINIGEYYASSEPATLYTTLGSCVAVCFFEKKARIGGMNHILLPGTPDLKTYNDSARFGINAVELLLNRIFSLGGKKQNLIAKIFGGAHLLPDFSIKDSPGRKNIEFVESFLRIESIPIISRHTGGTFTRTIYFHTDTSEIYLKKIRSSFFKTFSKEEEFLNKYPTQIIKPDTTIF